MEVKIAGRNYASLLKLIFVALYFTQYKKTFKYGLTKVHLGFSINLTEKTEQTFWLTQYLQIILFFWFYLFFPKT